MRHLELSRLGTEAILSYLDLSGERGAGGEAEDWRAEVPFVSANGAASYQPAGNAPGIEIEKQTKG